MEFHTWCVSDPLTSSCALILLAERLPVTYSKVPPVRIKGSKVETRGNEAMEYSLPFTAWPQYHLSVHKMVYMRKRKGQIEWQMRQFKRKRSRKHKTLSVGCFAELSCREITARLDQVGFSHAQSQSQVWKDFIIFQLESYFLSFDCHSYWLWQHGAHQMNSKDLFKYPTKQMSECHLLLWIYIFPVKTIR